jgi:hypothetical protein
MGQLQKKKKKIPVMRNVIALWISGNNDGVAIISSEDSFVVWGVLL